MASYLLDRITMGSIISFNYVKPGVEPGERVVLLLTPNWLGDVHGIKVAGLTPTEQEYLQEVFASLYSNPENLQQSVKDTMNRRLEEIKILNQKRADLLRKQQAVVMRPAGFMGQAVQKGRQLLGSVIGKITTFGRTQAQPVPQQQNPMLNQEIQNNTQAIQAKQMEYQQLVQYLETEKSRWAQIGRVPRDPYRLYHQVLKPMFPARRLAGMYRKYKVSNVVTPRVISTPKGQVIAT